MAPLTLNGTQVEMELDTGATVSLMTKQQWDRLPTQFALAPSTVTLSTYTGEHVHVHGEATVRVGYAGQEHTLSLVVVDGKGRAQISSDETGCRPPGSTGPKSSR